MRVDRLLVYLRFSRTRSRARALIEEGHLRCNGRHIRRSCDSVTPGDVLTIPFSNEVRVVEILSLPERRGPPGLARSHYRELDRSGKSLLAAAMSSSGRTDGGETRGNADS